MGTESDLSGHQRVWVKRTRNGSKTSYTIHNNDRTSVLETGKSFADLVRKHLRPEFISALRVPAPKEQWTPYERLSTDGSPKRSRAKTQPTDAGPSTTTGEPQTVADDTEGTLATSDPVDQANPASTAPKVTEYRTPTWKSVNG
jgi:hypothetical protein